MNQSVRQKRFMMVGGVALVVTVILVLYFIFFRTQPTADIFLPTFGDPSGVREGFVEERDTGRANGLGVFSQSSRLRLLSEEPVSGAVSLFTTEGTQGVREEVVRYGERKTAHIYDIDLNQLEKERVSNTTIPRIYESLWTASGKGVILRYLSDDNETIQTYFARLVAQEGGTSESGVPFKLEGNFLPNNISHLVISPDRTRLFWLTDTIQGSQAMISNPDGTNAQSLFAQPFSEWLPQWHSNNALTLTTRASAHAEGFSYFMPVSTANLERTIGNVSGLTTLTSPNGRYVLYSQGTTRTLSTYLYDTKKGTSSTLSIKTLPEKCAWADDEILYCGVPESLASTVYPDAWYQGKLLFTDTIYMIDSESKRASSLYSPKTRDGEILDIYKPFISESGDYFIFNNKHDMSLWAFTLNYEESLNLPSPDDVIGL